MVLRCREFEMNKGKEKGVERLKMKEGYSDPECKKVGRRTMHLLTGPFERARERSSIGAWITLALSYRGERRG